MYLYICGSVGGRRVHFGPRSPCHPIRGKCQVCDPEPVLRSLLGTWPQSRYERTCDPCVRRATVAAAARPRGRRYRFRVAGQRLDTALAERGLFPSRAAAAASIRAGEVRIGRDGPFALKPSQLVEAGDELIIEGGPRYVSRGGIKLQNALDELGIGVTGRELPRRRRLDRRLHRLPAPARRRAGGGGRRRLRAARDFAARRPAGDGARAGERPRAAPAGPPVPARIWPWSTSRSSPCARSCPPVASCLTEDAGMLAMVKPQFEVGRAKSRGGVVRSPRTAARRSSPSQRAPRTLAFGVAGLASSGLPGPKGNRETSFTAPGTATPSPTSRQR